MWDIVDVKNLTLFFHNASTYGFSEYILTLLSKELDKKKKQKKKTIFAIEVSKTWLSF